MWQTMPSQQWERAISLSAEKLTSNILDTQKT
jgi:hypothetical protein